MLLSLDFCVSIVHDGQKDRGMNAATSSVIENIRDFPSPLYWPLSDNVSYMPCVMLNEGLNVQQNEDFGTCLDNFLSTTNNRDNVFFPLCIYCNIIYIEIGFFGFLPPQLDFNAPYRNLDINGRLDRCRLLRLHFNSSASSYC